MNINLYRKNGGPPVPLPSEDYTEDGYIRTNFEYDEAVMTELGWVFDSVQELPDPTPLEPVPLRRREIRKSIVQARLNDVSMFDVVYAVLTDPGTPKIYFGRWFSPDWPNVFFDDNDMLLMFMAAGMTEEQIAYVTANDPGVIYAPL